MQSRKELQQLSTRKLRAMIRQVTAEVNIQIAGYRENVKAGKTADDKITNYMINRLVRTAGAKGRRGEVGLGYARKRKGELVTQLYELNRFMEIDINIPVHAKKHSERLEKARNTWNKTYGYISQEDFGQLAYDMSAVAEALESYGYEDIGGALAEQYQKSKKKDKFLKRVLEARDKAKGGTPEDIIDQLADILKREGEI